MIFNIQEFKSQVDDKQFSRPNLFVARFALPQGLQGRYQEQFREMEFWCEATNLPGVMLATYDANRYSYGPREKRPITTVVQDTAFTFFADGARPNSQQPTQGSIFDVFTTWIRLASNFNFNTIFGPSNDAVDINNVPYEIGYKIDYVTDIEVITFDQAGNESHHVTLRDAFPLMMADTRVNWGEQGIMRLNVIFTYTDWFLTNTQT
jgi:hypothetical protein